MVVLLHILDSMNLNRAGFREKSYFKHLKTQSKISACHLFRCSHVRITFVLNSLPVCPLLYPKPLNIYFSCYHNSEVKKYNIQFNVTVNSTLYTIFEMNYREFFVTQLNGFLIVEWLYFWGLKSHLFVSICEWLFLKCYWYFCVCECMTITTE